MTVITYVGPTSTITTRVLGGSLPGPLLVLLPGEKLKISFSNDVYETPDFPAREKLRAALFGVGATMLSCGVFGCLTIWFLSSSGSLGRGTKCTCGVHLSYQCFFLLGGFAVTSVGVMTTAGSYLHDADVTNLHFHGAFASSNAPSDDVLANAVPAGGTYQYEVDIPADHMPGTLPALLDNMTVVTWVDQHFRRLSLKTSRTSWAILCSPCLHPPAFGSSAAFPLL